MKKTSFEDALILNTTRGARFLTHGLPWGVSLGIARALGTLVFFLSKRRKIALKNLRAAFAGERPALELERIALRSFQNLAMSAAEMLRIPDMDRRYIESHVKVIGAEKLQGPLRERRGIIFLTAHFGNWELLNVAGSLLGYPMVALARVQKHPRSDEYLNRIRASKGTQIIRKGMPIREILRALKSGRIVGMLSDQDGGKNGVFVDFFNRLSSTPGGAAAFALRTGAVIFPVFISRVDGSRHEVEVEGPLEIPESGVSSEDAERILLQQFARVLETKIRRRPDQWLWAHRRWKSTPNRTVLVLSDGKPGHQNQSLTVFEAIRERFKNRGLPDACLTRRCVEVKFKNELFKNFLGAWVLLTGGRFPFKRWFCRLALVPDCFETLSRAYADIVVSCGHSLLGANLYMKEENSARSVVVMKPSFSPRYFDVLIVPRHDKIKKAANVFTTEGALVFSSSEALETESRRLAEETGLTGSIQKIGLLVGGDTDDVRFVEAPLQGIFDALDRHCRSTGAALLATSSRRTPSWADALLKRYFKENERCRLLVVANEANRPGVVQGILGLCDLVLVSGESMSMVSEAVASGKRVIVFLPFDKSRLKSKYRSFLNRLYETGRAAEADPATLQEIFTRVSLPVSAVSSSDGDREVLREAVEEVLR
ncbi:MAG: mitochondrial fission ELM1 family protein [Candidatus Omnitrophica bacterium]|nr:mitochondrial fission ELM1 family protein [Candidatus Omnitrophota bacterium]